MAAVQDHEDQSEEPRQVHLPSAVSASIIGIFVILLIGAIYYARSFFLPLILALLITMTFTPLVRYLHHRRGIPPSLSAVVLVLVIAGVGIGASIVLAAPVSRMIADAPQIIAALRERFSFLRHPIAVLVEAGREVSQLAEPSPEDAQRVVVAQPGILSWAADTVTGVGTTIGATLVLVIFLLSSGDLFLQKIVRSEASLSEKKRSLRIVHDVENEVSRYLMTITAINICFGFLIGLTMALFGMPNPVVWGVAAACLNYIPYVGAIVGIAVTAAVALITFPTVTMALFPPVTYLALHVAEGSFITPLILGRRLELNAVAILIALAFSGWMWGVIGAIIGVPLLVVVKVFCDRFPRLATFGAFLSVDAPIEANGDQVAATAPPVDRNAKVAGSP